MIALEVYGGTRGFSTTLAPHIVIQIFMPRVAVYMRDPMLGGMGSFWLWMILRHLISRGTKRGPYFCRLPYCNFVVPRVKGSARFLPFTAALHCRRPQSRPSRRRRGGLHESNLLVLCWEEWSITQIKYIPLRYFLLRTSKATDLFSLPFQGARVGLSGLSPARKAETGNAMPDFLKSVPWPGYT